MTDDPKTLTFTKVGVLPDAIVVVIDMRSSSRVLDAMGTKGKLRRLQDFITEVKRYLVHEQKAVLFDAHKFIGDGAILLFPRNTDRGAILPLLSRVCAFYDAEFKRSIQRHLAHSVRPGLAVGVDVGRLNHIMILGSQEYIARAINVAARLQSEAKKSRSAYTALVSDAAYYAHFAPATGFKVEPRVASLRNIPGASSFHCMKIELWTARAKRT